jgi:hypothetical protein
MSILSVLLLRIGRPLLEGYQHLGMSVRVSQCIPARQRPLRKTHGTAMTLLLGLWS